MNAQKRQAIIVKNADDASKKEKKMPLLRRKIERRHEKETMRAAEKMRRTAAWKSTAKDNFSGGKKIILVDSRPRICYNKLQILYCIRRAAR